MATHQSEAESIRVARSIIEDAFTGGDLDLLDELVAEEYVGYDLAQPEPMRGPADVRRTMEMYRAAFPDLAFELHETLADGELVAIRWTSRGTHEGELMGIDPTGAKTEVVGIEIDRVRDGKMVESWIAWDALGLLQQLGVVPEMPAE